MGCHETFFFFVAPHTENNKCAPDLTSEEILETTELKHILLPKGACKSNIFLKISVCRAKFCYKLVWGA